MIKTKREEVPSKLVVSLNILSKNVSVMREEGRELRLLELPLWDLVVFGKMPEDISCSIGEYHRSKPIRGYDTSKMSAREDGMVPPTLETEYVLKEKAARGV